MRVACGLVLTRTASRLLSKVVGAADKEATSRHGLIGSSGVVISSQITSDFGEIRAKDPTGNFVHLVCRIRPGEASITSGAEVVIVDYETTTGHIFVAPLDADFSPSPNDTGLGKKRIGAAAPAVSDAEAEAVAVLLAEQSEKREKTRSH